MKTTRNFQPCMEGAARTPALPRRLGRLGVGCLAFAWTAMAAAGVQEWASVSVGNNHAQNPGAYYNKGTALASQVAGTSRLIDTGQVTQTFTGLSADGLVEQETFIGQASAYGSFGSVKIGASYSLSNRLANGANPKYVNADSSVNAAGVPTAFRAEAEVRVKDSVTVTGGTGLDAVEFTYRLTGQVTTFEGGFNSANETLLLVSGFLAGSTGQLYLHDGSYDQLLVGRVKVVNGVADYSLSMFAVTGLTTVFPEYPWWFHGRDSNGVVDFMHTMDLVSVVGRAADGTEVALTRASGSTGFDYLAVAVPEPQAWMLMLAGLGLVGWRRFRPVSRTR